MWKAMNVFIEQMGTLYYKWDIRVMVLLSLLMQVLLQLLGNRRKFSRSVWLRIIVWFSYVTVDSIAIMALGTISTKLGRIGNSRPLDWETKLNALWAPCLLLLLGGPDSITSYSVEDNQLWLRHLLVLVVQTSVAGYVCFLAWAADCLSYMSLLLLVAGVIKYGERVWVLWQVSFDKLRSVGLERPMYLDWQMWIEHDGNELVGGYTMFQIFMHIFLNQKLHPFHRDRTKEMFNGLTPQKAFKIIEIELGFMYDLLHTKAKMTYTCWGLCRRLMTSTISCTVLAVFSWFVNKKTESDVNYPRIDVAVTFVLLATNISSEIYWVFMLLASDWAEVMWIMKEGSHCSKLIWNNNKNNVVRNTLLQLCRQLQWSNSAGQLSFFSLFLNIDERSLYCSRLLKLLCLHEKVGPYYHAHQDQEITDYIKDQIFMINKETINTRLLTSHRELLVYCCEDQPQLFTRMKMYDFDDMIMIWHIATELCYYYDDNENHPSSSSSSPASGDIMKARKAAMLLSRYIFYILLRYPLMLQTVDLNIKLKQTTHKVLQRFRDEISIFNRRVGLQGAEKSYVEKLFEAAEKRADNVLTLSFLVFIDGCILAKKLMIEGGENTSSNAWRFLLKSWLAHLNYAAYNCKEEYHTQQLRRGGELITHVWMLMVHLGLTNYTPTTEVTNPRGASEGY